MNHWPKLRAVIFLVLLTGLLTACAGTSPHLAQGVLDLRAYDLARQGPLRLRGEAEFYWGQLLTPADFAEAARPRLTGYIALPGSWNGYRVGDSSLTGDGYATYRFKVLLDQAPARLGLRLMAYETAYRLYVNGELVGENGVVGPSRQTMRPEWRPQVILFETATPTVEVVLQFSNFYHHKGGPEEPLWLGTPRQVEQQQQGALAWNLILLSSLGLMGLYHLLITALRRRELSPLYFGLICLAMALRLLVSGEYPLVYLSQAFPWAWLVKANYLSLAAIFGLFSLYIPALFSNVIARRFVQGAVLVSGVWGGLVLLTPPRWFTATLRYYQVGVLLGSLYLLSGVWRAARQRRPGAVAFLVSGLCLLALTLNDVLYNNELVQTGYWSPWGLLTFVLVQMVILAQRFVTALRQVEALTGTLEQQVTERTQELMAANQELAAANLSLQQEIQQRQAAEAEQRRYAERFRLLHEIDQGLLAASSLETLATVAVGRVRALLACQRVAILAYTLQDQAMLLAAESDGSLPGAPEPELLRLLAQWPVLRQGYLMGTEDLAAVPVRTAWQAHLYEQGLRAALFVPLVAQGEVLGLLTLEARQPHAFDQQVALAQEIGTILAVAMYQTRLVELLQRELADRKRAESKLRQLLQAVEQSASTVVITNLTGEIEYVNPAFTVITGYTQAEAIGQNPRILRSGRHPPEFYSQLWQTILRGETWQGELINRRKDGELYWEATTISPVRDEAGRITHFVAVKEDITRRKAIEAALTRRTQELEASNAELDAFAHTVAHDLKTPLTIIVGFGELLQMRAGRMSPDEMNQALQTIVATGHKMSSIINELLLLASMRKMDQVALGRLDMGQIVAEVQRRLQFEIARTGAELLLPATWPVAIGYAPWVEEVWVNYVSNALKYGGCPGEGRPPRVELGWEWVPVAAQASGPVSEEATLTGQPMEPVTAPAFVRFWVRDNGPGLTAEQRMRLFSAFTRLDQARAEGHGLGLSIVQRIVARLGGEVGVESAVGVGSTFYFTLPAAESP